MCSVRMAYLIKFDREPGKMFPKSFHGVKGRGFKLRIRVSQTQTLISDFGTTLNVANLIDVTCSFWNLENI